MKEVYLSREIENDSGYIDEVINEIKAVPQDEELHMLITCIGGDTFQGDRIYRAISEHGGKTKAIVIGAAISMGASILPAFDSVELDEGAEIMLHSARPKDQNGDEMTAEQTGLVERFNKKTKNRMINDGVNAEFVEKVFVSETDENHWLTAEEAEALGLGKVVLVDKEEKKSQLAIAAKLDISHLKQEKKDMDLFKKAVPRIINLADGRQAVFNSKNEELKKGDTLTLVGSSEKLTGKIELENSMLAELSGTSEVVALEEIEAPSNEVTDEMFAELSAQVAELRDAVAQLAGASEESEEEVAAKLKAEEEEEEKIEAKNKEAEALVDQAKTVLANTLEAAEALKSTFVVPKVENKREESEQVIAKLDSGIEQAIKFKEIQKEIQNSKK